jgi:hypothetical protein
LLLVDEADRLTDDALAGAGNVAMVLVCRHPRSHDASGVTPADHVELGALDTGEARSFLDHRLLRTGSPSSLTPDAASLIIAAGRGSPGRLRLLAGQAQFQASLDGAPQIELVHAEGAVQLRRDLDGGQRHISAATCVASPASIAPAARLEASRAEVPRQPTRARMGVLLPAAVIAFAVVAGIVLAPGGDAPAVVGAPSLPPALAEADAAAPPVQLPSVAATMPPAAEPPRSVPEDAVATAAIDVRFPAGKIAAGPQPGRDAAVGDGRTKQDATPPPPVRNTTGFSSAAPAPRIDRAPDPAATAPDRAPQIATPIILADTASIAARVARAPRSSEQPNDAAVLAEAAAAREDARLAREAATAARDAMRSMRDSL